MDDLVAQGVKPVENNGQYGIGILSGQSLLCTAAGIVKLFQPNGFADFAVVVIPKRLENVAVVQQIADVGGKFVPYQRVELFFLIEAADGAEEEAQIVAFGGFGGVLPIAGIGSVERNLQ